MRFLTDANVFVPMVDGLRILGHDVFDIKEQKLIRKISSSQRKIIVTF